MSPKMTKQINISNDSKEDNNNTATKERNHNTNRDIDGGWAWIVLFTSFIAAILSAGQFFNSGLYFYIFLNAFGESRSKTMWITASQSAASGLSGIVASNLIITQGHRKTMIMGSIIMGTSYGMAFFANSVPYAIVCFTSAGVGSSFLFISNVTSAGLYFKKKLSIATGIVLAGAGLGTTIIGLEIEWSVSTFGWRGAMLIQSALIFQICVCAAMLYDITPSTKHKSSKDLKPSSLESENKLNTITISNNTDGKHLNDSKSQTTRFPFLFDIRFWTQIMGFTFYFASAVIVFQVLKDFVVSNNFSFQYSLVMVCNGVGNCVGRFCGGILASLITPTLLGSVVTILCGLSISMLLFTSFDWIVLLGIMLFGFTNGLQGAPHTLSWVSLFGQELMAVVFGFSWVSGVIPTLVMSPLAGYIVDETGSFTPVILLASASMLISGMMFFLTHTIHKKKLGIHTFDHSTNLSEVATIHFIH